MPLYAAVNTNAGSQQNMASAYKTLLAWAAATGATTLRRGWLWEWEIGAADVPNSTDCPINIDFSLQTAAGTATTLTPNPTDSGGGDAAALLAYVANATVEPTYTASSSLQAISINQRATQRWIAKDKASCLVSAAVNAKGIGVRVKSPNYASIMAATCYIEE